MTLVGVEGGEASTSVVRGEGSDNVTATVWFPFIVESALDVEWFAITCVLARQEGPFVPEAKQIGTVIKAHTVRGTSGIAGERCGMGCL